MVSQRFQHQSSVLANYSYTDVAEGTGVTDYKGFKSWISGSAVYALTTSDPYSNYHPNLSATENGIDTVSSVVDATDTLKLGLNFDVSAFNLPQVIRGTAIINVPISIQNDIKAHLEIHIQNATTSTTIASAESGLVSGTGATIYPGILCIPIVIPETVFQAGEVLRVRIEGWGIINGATAGIMALAHDPQARASDMFVAGNTTVLHCYIPFKIDV